jgi:putative ABC transport system permease protein
VSIDGWPGLPAWTASEVTAVQARVNALASSIHATAVPLEQVVDPATGTYPGPPSDAGVPDVHGGSVRVQAIAGSGTAPPPGTHPIYAPALLGKLASGQGLAKGNEVTNTIPVYVATPEVLHFVGLSPSAIRGGTDIVTPRKTSGLVLTAPPPQTDTPVCTAPVRSACPPGPSVAPHEWRPTVQKVDLPTYTSDATTLITQGAVQKFGLRTVPAGWLLRTPKPLTTAQIDTARKTAAAVGATVETRPSQVTFSRLRTGATTAGVIVALAVLAMTVGLIRSEAANDLRTLAATGASSTTRRMLTAATAGSLALLGALLGTAGAYVALFAWHRRDLSPLGHVPYVNLAVLIVGLPLLAIAGGLLFAGREPPAIARRPIE